MNDTQDFSWTTSGLGTQPHIASAKAFGTLITEPRRYQHEYGCESLVNSNTTRDISHLELFSPFPSEDCWL